MAQNSFVAYVFTDDPEDYWFGWQKLSELEKFIQEKSVPLTPLVHRDEIVGFDLGDRLRQLLYATQEAAVGLGWEGDVRNGAAYGVVHPSLAGNIPHISVAWKQDNNGTCFFGSTDPDFGVLLSKGTWGHSGAPGAIVVVESRTHITFAKGR